MARSETGHSNELETDRYRQRLQQLVDDYALGHLSFEQLSASVQGWVNHVRYGNTVGLRTAVLQEIIIPPVHAVADIPTTPPRSTYSA